MKTTKAMREELRKDFVHGDFNALSEDGSIGPALLDDIEMLHEKLIRYINDRGKSSSKINSLESEVARLRGLVERMKPYLLGQDHDDRWNQLLSDLEKAKNE